MLKNRKFLIGCFFAIPVLCVMTLCLAYLFLQAFFPLVIIEGESMEPNYHEGEVWALNRTTPIEKGDVIVFHKPGMDSLIKRVIAMPGDTIQLKNGDVYVNDTKLEEKYLDPATKTLGKDFLSDGMALTVPVDSYFVMGDNRYHSLDSRSSDVGFIKKEWLIGKLSVKLEFLSIKKS